MLGRKASAGAKGQVLGRENKCVCRRASAGTEGQVQGQEDKCKGRRASAGGEGQVLIASCHTPTGLNYVGGHMNIMNPSDLTHVRNHHPKILFISIPCILM